MSSNIIRISRFCNAFFVFKRLVQLRDILMKARKGFLSHEKKGNNQKSLQVLNAPHSRGGEDSAFIHHSHQCLSPATSNEAEGAKVVSSRISDDAGALFKKPFLILLRVLLGVPRSMLMFKVFHLLRILPIAISTCHQRTEEQKRPIRRTLAFVDCRSTMIANPTQQLVQEGQESALNNREPLLGVSDTPERQDQITPLMVNQHAAATGS